MREREREKERARENDVCLSMCFKESSRIQGYITWVCMCACVVRPFKHAVKHLTNIIYEDSKCGIIIRAYDVYTKIHIPRNGILFYNKHETELIPISSVAKSSQLKPLKATYNSNSRTATVCAMLLLLLLLHHLHHWNEKSLTKYDDGKQQRKRWRRWTSNDEHAVFSVSLWAHHKCTIKAKNIEVSEPASERMSETTWKEQKSNSRATRLKADGGCVYNNH